MRRPLVAGNWKMNGSRALTEALVGAIAENVVERVDVLVCPPSCYLVTAAAMLADARVMLGAQDCSDFDPGAYTGEVAAAMLRDVGCSHVIVGHSERRTLFGDTDARVASKVTRALAAGLTPVLCVGETLDERARGDTEATVARQLDAVLGLPDGARLVNHLTIAYEPVWAIGTGESATPEQAQTVHAFIRARLERLDAEAAAGARILYGGSVKPDNARELFAMPDIDGGLIGGASLVADSFLSICRAAC